LQLGDRVEDQPSQHGLPRWAQGDDDRTLVVPVAPALHHASRLQPIDQLHHGVVSDLKAFGERADRGGPAARQSFDLEQNQVLLRFHSCLAGGQLADAQKTADLVAQIREGLIVHGGNAADRPRSKQHREH
jgi:hypothetical protein